MTPATTRRAAMLALALTATACDLVQFASDPKPRFEETWNLPGPDTRMSVADLLPAGTVTIKSDSSAFILKIDSTNITAALGPNCAACIALNGTSAPKPAFSMSPGNSTNLPTDIVSAVILAGSINIKLVNNLTFDPLFVNTGGGAPPQGKLIILIHSGAVVLGKDSIQGAVAASGTAAQCPNGQPLCNTPLPPGGSLNRVIPLSTGTVTNNLTVDVVVTSPLGDHLVPIDVSKSFFATASVPSIEVGSVSMNVPSRTFNSGGADSVSMPTTGDFVVGLGMDMTLTNPFKTLSGGLNLTFAWGPGPTQKITKPVTLPTGCAVAPCVGTSVVSLDSTETQTLLNGGDKVSISVTGSVSASSPIAVNPKMEIKVANRLRLKIRTPGGGK